MSLSSISYIALAVFLVLYGLMTVTNIKVEFMPVICGFAALIAGIFMFILGVRRTTP